MKGSESEFRFFFEKKAIVAQAKRARRMFFFKRLSNVAKKRLLASNRSDRDFGLAGNGFDIAKTGALHASPQLQCAPRSEVQSLHWVTNIARAKTRSASLARWGSSMTPSIRSRSRTRSHRVDVTRFQRCRNSESVRSIPRGSPRVGFHKETLGRRIRKSTRSSSESWGGRCSSRIS